MFETKLCVTCMRTGLADVNYHHERKQTFCICKHQIKVLNTAGRGFGAREGGVWGLGLQQRIEQMVNQDTVRWSSTCIDNLSRLSCDPEFCFSKLDVTVSRCMQLQCQQSC